MSDALKFLKKRQGSMTPTDKIIAKLKLLDEPLIPITLRLPKTLHNTLTRLSDNHGVSINALIVAAINNALEGN